MNKIQEMLHYVVVSYRCACNPQACTHQTKCFGPFESKEDAVLEQLSLTSQYEEMCNIIHQVPDDAPSEVVRTAEANAEKMFERYSFRVVSD